MSSGEIPFLRVHSLPIGTRLFHSHPWGRNPSTGRFDYPVEAFNPVSKFRFAAVDTVPTTAMWWGSESLDCAIWETVLRSVYAPNPSGKVYVPPDLYRGRRLSAVRTLVPLSVVEVMTTPLRGMGVDDKGLAFWAEMTTTPDHSITHAPTLKLLAKAKMQGVDVHGLTWFSRQIGSRGNHPLALVLYAPPCAPEELFEPDPDPRRAPVDFDSKDGKLLLQSVLAQSNLEWLDDPMDECSTEDPETD